MKKIFTVLALTIILKQGISQTISFPQASPTTTISQNFSMSKIELSFSRPGVKGRKIFGDVVPFDKVWRTGANSATTISFGEDVKINGNDIKAGKYGLLSIPGEREWIVILTKDLNVTSAADYKKENDVLRLSVKPEMLSYTVETFEIKLSNVKNNQADIEIVWDRTSVAFKVSSDLDTKLSKQITDVMSKDARPYFQSANWYYENNKDLKTALDWTNKAYDMNPKAYWVLHLKAKIQKNMKDYNAAVATANLSIEKAKSDSDDTYVRNNEKLIAEIKALPDYTPAATKKKKIKQAKKELAIICH